MHVAQADGVACLAAVKACVLSDGDADVITKRIDDCGANAATGSAPCNDEAVTAEQRQIAYQITSKKDARLLLIYNNILWLWREFGNDFVRVAVSGFHGRRLGGAIVLPGPAARIPVILAEGVE